MRTTVCSALSVAFILSACGQTPRTVTPVNAIPSGQILTSSVSSSLNSTSVAQDGDAWSWQEGFFFEMTPDIANNENFWANVEYSSTFYLFEDDVDFGPPLGPGLGDGPEPIYSYPDWGWLAVGGVTGGYIGYRECQAKNCSTSQLVGSIAYHGALGVLGGGRGEVTAAMFNGGRRVIGFIHGSASGAGIYELGTRYP